MFALATSAWLRWRSSLIVIVVYNSIQSDIFADNSSERISLGNIQEVERRT